MGMGGRRRGGLAGARSDPPPEPPPGHADLVERVHALPRRRTYLLPALHVVQDALGWLPEWGVELVGAHLRVPRSEVFGIASSFPELRLTEPAEQRVRVCTGTSCRLGRHGGLALRDGLRAQGLRVGEADCLFICGVGPAAEVDGRPIGRASLATFSALVAPEATPPGTAVLAVGVAGVTVGAGQVVLVQDGTCSRAVAGGTAEPTAPRAGTAEPTLRRVGCAGNCWQAPAISLDGGRTWRSARAGQDDWTQPAEVRLLARVGVVEPLAVPAYDALERGQSLGSQAVWQLVREAGLRGRGGAYFPVGAKWETARDTASGTGHKYLLVNAEEGEPGIYKDRHLLEGDPHRIVEGIQIAALGMGATEVVIFVNGEAHLGHERLLAALEQARQLGALGVPVEVRRGAGGYVLGEETTLINAIHGLRAEPLARPPFPAVSGLFASPTVINNVETLANLPDVVRYGAEWFRQVGTPQTPGTKLVSLAGAVRRPGLYEVALGTPLGAIVQDRGGGATGDLAALIVGGPSGSILPASLLETPFDVQPLQAVGGVLGAGGIVPLTVDQCVVATVRELVAFNARESCGKCTPCREGTQRLLDLFDSVCGGRANPATLQTIDDLNDVLAFGSLCGLGQMTPNPVRALLRHFAAEVHEHLGGACRAGVCRAGANGVA